MSTLSPELQHHIQAFADALLATEQSDDFVKARTTFEGDETAIDLMTRLNTLSYELSRKQHAGTLEQHEIAQYKEVQEEFISNEVVAELEQRERMLVELMRECNHEISGMLGLDFAKDAAQSSCGCSS
ncbi:Control of competence regulator ComK, YlbF/YmcA [Cyclonatronum proteinivorum]|uniref:Control of competence regulator ComK, YlbF/YmcA n=1 Tax=Cyclonatronum proteinivorum TaxID=1457365 RepID=A0A345UGV1_9BACT|nr:YlbF family regulator [Cyclonatronum proteinivorum]AXI99702.1 Control of competence regulator ComK, YlbF/YmcA [Cyclonatronum proteinivorum]